MNKVSYTGTKEVDDIPLAGAWDGDNEETDQSPENVALGISDD